MLRTSLALLVSALAFTSAAPLEARSSNLTAATIQAIAPETATCSGATYAAECHTAAQAAPAIQASFAKYKLDTVGEQAAAIAIMLFESNNFKFNKNHGEAGRGCKNMQSLAFNNKYATAVFGAAKANQAAASGPNAVLDLLSQPNETFGSAAWFITTVCPAAVRTGLQAGTAQGWSNFLSQCNGLPTSTPQRDQYWKVTLQTLKSAGN